MDHGVDSSSRGDLGEKANGEFRIENGKVGVELGRDHSRLGRHAIGDDGSRRHFRSGARCSRNLYQWQPVSLHVG